MGGYLDKVRELERLWMTQGGDKEPAIGMSPEFGLQGGSDEVFHESPQQEMYCEISEISEIRAALLVRLRTGHSWLLAQHQRWQSGDSTAADDSEFSRKWNGWWELDQRLRADHGFQGCIYGSDETCPAAFPCQGCANVPLSGVVAQLELTSPTSNR